MSINSVIGLMSSGKTLFITYMGFIAWLNGKTVITNYDVFYPHIKINKDWLIDLASREDHVLPNVCFLLDEIWIWMDSRKSQENTVGTYFFLQSSKDDTEIYLTAQTNQQNDKRLRQNAHIITQCSRVEKINNKFIPINSEQRFLSPEQQERLYIKATVCKRMNFGMISDIIPKYHRYIKAKPMFRLYNTRQKIRYISK